MVDQQDASNRLGWIAALGRTLSARLVALLMAVVLAVLVIVPVAGWCYGTTGAMAAMAAALVSLGSGLAAMLVAACFRGPQAAMVSMLTGMGIRMAVPLAIGLVVHYQVASWSAAGFLIWLLGFYLVVLTIETLLEVARLQPASADRGGLSPMAVSTTRVR